MDLDKRISRFLISLKGNGRYLDFLCTDASGRAVAASDPALLGRDDRDRPWHRAISSGNEFLGVPAASPDERPAAIEIAAPVYDPEQPGVRIGALLGLYDWRHVSLLAEQIRQDLAELGSTVDIAIVDGDGRAVAGSWHTPPASLLGQDLRALGWTAVERGRRAARPGYVREAGPAALVGFASLGAVKPDWVALAIQSRHDALAPVSQLEHHLAWILGAVLFAALAVASVFAERISRPLPRLRRSCAPRAAARLRRRGLLLLPAEGKLARGRKLHPSLRARPRARPRVHLLSRSARVPEDREDMLGRAMQPIATGNPMRVRLLARPFR